VSFDFREERDLPESAGQVGSHAFEQHLKMPEHTSDGAFGKSSAIECHLQEKFRFGIGVEGEWIVRSFAQ
jgi:hypothetical protein